MKIVPTLAATTGAAALTAGLVAFVPSTPAPSAQPHAPVLATPAAPVTREVQLTAGIGDIFSWAYWISVAPWAFVPLSVFTTAPVPPEEFVPPTFGTPGETLASFYTSTQPWGEFALKYSAYAAGWVPLGVALVQPELLPVVLALIVYSVVAPTVYDVGEAFVTPAVNAIAGMLGAPAPTQTPAAASAASALTLAETPQVQALQATTPQLADKNAAEPQAAGQATAPELDVPASADAEAVSSTGPVAGDSAVTPEALPEGLVSEPTQAATDSATATSGPAATATVAAQGEVRGGGAKTVTDVADAVTSPDKDSSGEAVATAPTTVTAGVGGDAKDAGEGAKAAAADSASGSSDGSTGSAG